MGWWRNTGNGQKCLLAFRARVSNSDSTLEEMCKISLAFTSCVEYLDAPLEGDHIFFPHKEVKICVQLLEEGLLCLEHLLKHYNSLLYL